MAKCKFYFIFILLFYFLPATLLANTDYRFAHITSQEGLPHQQVEVLMQDDKGRIWIGTRNGLAVYDGYDIVNYFHHTDNPNSLNHNFVKSIYQDSRNRIWIGTYGGICMFQPESNNFKRYNVSDVNIFSILENGNGQVVCGGSQLYSLDETTDEFVMHPRENPEFILSMALDKHNRLFLSTNHSISYYDTTFSNSTQIKSSYFADFITDSDGIIPLFFDSKGLLWIGRNGDGVMSINLENGEKNIYPPSVLSNGTVRTITEDHAGKIWLGTEKGITILTPDKNIEIIQQNFTDKNKLNDNAIYSILCDKDDNMWIGTYFGGINLLLKNNKQFDWIEAGYGQKNIHGKAVRRIIEPQKNNLWIATEDGGLNIYNTETKDINDFHLIPNLGHNIHELLHVHEYNEIWIGTFRNGLFCYNLTNKIWKRYMPSDQKGLSSDAIFCLQRQKNGTIWIGSTQGLRYYDRTTDSFKRINHPILDTGFIYTLLVDQNDNLWVGTRNNGVFFINQKTQEIKGWTTKKNNSSITDKYITCLFQDSDNKIWVGTNAGGLQYINPNNFEVNPLNKNISLSQSIICSIIEDKSKQLWVSTSSGLYKFNKKRDSAVHYTIQDGLPINQFNFSSSILAQNGLFYFGSVNGIVSFNPLSLKEEKKLFHVHFTCLNIDNQLITINSPNSPLNASIDNMSSITFSYQQSRSFYIGYAAISPGNSNNINYQIKLEGVDNTWRNVGKERKFVGSNLPAGTYRLLIRANNTNSHWELAPIKKIELSIQPPFYLSNWAYILYICLLILILYISYHIFSIRLKEKDAVRIAKMEKENADEMNKTKMDFFMSVSHELKTPLSLIMAPLKYILQHQELSKESTERLEIAIRNTNKMVGLIEELVTFNKVESGNFQFYIEKGNPLNFIENIAYLFKESAVEKSISFYIHCEDNGEEVWFSPSYVEKIINNLLSNAIKFTPTNGHVYINASITDGSDGYDYLLIEVKDDGIGIAQNEIDNIWDKYYQTKRGHNTNNKGWGIGLALVKHLVSIHKGTVSVNSNVNKGSCFTVNLNVSESAFNTENKILSDKTVVPLSQYKFNIPYSEHTLQKQLTNQKNDKNNPEKQSHILLVEDNEELLTFLSDIFCTNYIVYPAQNGLEALEIAHKYPIDLVISDIMIPRMDGYTLCRTLKGDPSTSHILVILLTAKSDPDDIIKGYECGAEAYVPKPFDPEILELQVKNIIHMKQTQCKRIIKTFGSDIESVTLSQYDKEFIDNINNIIEKNIDNPEFTITDITQTLCISRSLLHIKMKSLFNISTGDYIRKKRLHSACELLHKGYNISDTCYKIGYADPNYFSKVFKKEFGVTPTDYINHKP